MNWTFVFTFFRSLTLDHLERSLYSISKQTIKADDYVFFDNNTDYSESELISVLSQYPELDWRMVFEKHRDPAKTTASWCQNRAIELAKHDLFVLGKADLIYDFDFCRRLLEVQGNVQRRFSTCWLFQMGYYSGATHADVNHATDLEALNWRENPQLLLQNRVPDSREEKVTQADAASFATTKQAMDIGGWYDERLTHWGYWQQDLQYQMRNRGVHFVVIPEFLMFHMMHQIEGEPRNPRKGFDQWMAIRR